MNGRPESEPRTLGYWAKSCHDVTSNFANTAPVTVAPGHYFVIGDNRSAGGSLDSRMFGVVKRNDIAGRAVLSLWPLAERGEVQPPCQAEAAPEPQEEGSLRWSPRWLPTQPR